MYQEGQPIRYYIQKAERLKQDEKMTMYVDFYHLSNYPHDDPEFIKNVVQHYYKYEPDLRRALARFMQTTGNDNAGGKNRYYQIAIYNLPQMNKIRDLRTLSLGRLMSIYGTVTRTTDAKPELIMGTFQCCECQNYVKNVE